MKNKETDWGWTSYKKTGWITDDGRKAYTACFRTNGTATGKGCLIFTTAKIHFYAKHPIKALRNIVRQVNGGTGILSFNGQKFD